MSSLTAAAGVSLAFTAILALLGRAPFRDEFGTRARQGLALLLWVTGLALVIFLPLTRDGGIEDLDAAEMPFLSLFAGHAVMVAVLGLWWRLRSDLPFLTFLRLSPRFAFSHILAGLRIGVGAWFLTLTAAAGFLLLAQTVGPFLPEAPQLGLPEDGGIPVSMQWLAELSLVRKACLVGVAMTVEEAFFRSFLQPRIGGFTTSVLFALAHFGYGLPHLVVGVFALSLVLSWTFARWKDVLPCMVIHGLFDSIQLFLVLPVAVEAATRG